VITPSPIRIGTRKSALAIAQASQVAEAMGVKDSHGLVTMVSSGDKIAGPLHEQGGKSLFTKELDAALLRGEVDLVVHSMKDVETPLQERLEIAAIPPRLDPRDVLILKSNIDLKNTRAPITIGTCSLRREHQLKFHHPNISVTPCRGNIQTRLQKYANGDFDGIILALAGLTRLGIFNENRIDGIDAHLELLDVHSFVPAPGQGALAIVRRVDDKRFDNLLQKIHHPDSFLAIQIERSVTEALNLSCHDPVGIYAQIEGATFSLHVQLFKGQRLIEKKVQGLLKNQEKTIKNLIAEILFEAEV